MEARVKFAKVKEGAVIPSKREEDMGFDIYACFDEDYIVLEPNEVKLIPTGIASACNHEYGFLLRERGSTGSKGLALRAGVIDSGFRNMWWVCLSNITDHDIFITKLSAEETIEKHYDSKRYGDFDANFWEYVRKNVCYPYSKAIAQALVIPVPKVEIEEVSYDELCAIESERGMGALGSSNK